MSKLSLRSINPFEILERVGKGAYGLALPPHDVFHVSMVRKYVLDLSHVMELRSLSLREDLTYEEHPMRIVDKKDKVLLLDS